jgi:hypothetical protein
MVNLSKVNARKRGRRRLEIGDALYEIAQKAGFEPKNASRKLINGSYVARVHHKAEPQVEPSASATDL